MVFIKLIVYDFDGVMTDNKVFVDQHGNEMVQLSRADGLGIAEIKNCDAIILATAHDEFISLDWNEIGRRMRNKIVYDGRRCLNLNELEKFGWHTYAIGRP